MFVHMYLLNAQPFFLQNTQGYELERFMVLLFIKGQFNKIHIYQDPGVEHTRFCEVP